jgi:ribonuclease M5
MQTIKEWVVVEGKHDSARLKLYYHLNTIETHGTYLSHQLLEQMKQIQERYGLIVFTDPDSSGNSIRQRISMAIPNVKHAYLSSDQCRSKLKVGIEHASFESIDAALHSLLTYHESSECWVMSDLVKLKLTIDPLSNKRRNYLSKALVLGDCNAKTLLKRLNARNITYLEVETVLAGFYE